MIPIENPDLPDQELETEKVFQVDDVTVCYQVACADWERTIQDLDDLAAKVVQQVQGILDVEPGEMSIIFADDHTIQRMNARYRGKDQPTNVLSFAMLDSFGDDDFVLADGGEEGRVYGDIALAYETMVREAREQKKTLDAHTYHLVTHGVLHLLGFDHQIDEDAEEMEDLEREILDKLGVSDPYSEQEKFQ